MKFLDDDDDDDDDDMYNRFTEIITEISSFSENWNSIVVPWTVTVEFWN